MGTGRVLLFFKHAAGPSLHGPRVFRSSDIISHHYREPQHGARGEDLDCISIGPTIRAPHSPSESLQVETTDGTQTVQLFYNAVSNILDRIFG